MFFCYVRSLNQSIKFMQTSKLKNYICNCFFTQNFFVKSLGQHITYHNDQQFLQDYSETLKSKGLADKTNDILNEIHIELDRRKRFGPEFLERRMLIRENYKKLHPDIFVLQAKHFDPTFLDIIEKCRHKDVKKEEILSMIEIHKPIEYRLYNFPIFTQEFCEKLVQEIENFEKCDNVPKIRPNTMNRYGVSLAELGFEEEFLLPLRVQYMRPLCAILFPDWGGNSLDSDKGFIVKYMINEDTELNYHYDNSEVTLNVCLNKDFEGGDLYFGEMRGEQKTEEFAEIPQRPYLGLLHRGQQRHGALPITKGKRYNMIVWMRSSAIRNKMCPMCGSDKPQLVCAEGYGDGFTSDVIPPTIDDLA